MSAEEKPEAIGGQRSTGEEDDTEDFDRRRFLKSGVGLGTVAALGIAGGGTLVGLALRGPGVTGAPSCDSLPSSDDTCNLGSIGATPKRWKNLYLSRDITFSPPTGVVNNINLAGGNVNAARNLPEAFNVKGYGAKGDGSTPDSTSIANAAAAVPSGGGDLQFPPGTYFINSNLTLSSNVRLVFSTGAMLKVAKGVTVTINGRLSAPVSQIFSLQDTGVVNFGSTYQGERYLPQWWGAKGDGITDDSAAIQGALNAVSVTGGTAFFPDNSTFAIGTPLIIKQADPQKPVRCMMGSSKIIILSSFPNNRGMIEFSTDIFRYPRFERLHLDGNARQGTGIAGIKFDQGAGMSADAIRFIIEHCLIHDLSGDGIHLAGEPTLVQESRLLFNTLSGNGIAGGATPVSAGNGIYLLDIEDSIVLGNRILNWKNGIFIDCLTRLHHVGRFVSNYISRNGDVSNPGYGILMRATGQTIGDVVISGSEIKNNWLSGVRIEALGGNTVRHCRLVHNLAIRDNNTSTGTGEDSAGIFLTGASTATLDDILIQGNAIGAVAGSGVFTQKYGVAVDDVNIPTYNNCVLKDNNFFANLTAALLDVNNKLIRSRNTGGLDPLGIAAITVGASPFTYTNNDGVPEAVYIFGGNITTPFVQKNGVTVYQAGGGTVWLESGESVTVTWTTTAPTMNKDRK